MYKIQSDFFWTKKLVPEVHNTILLLVDAPFQCDPYCDLLF